MKKIFLVAVLCCAAFTVIWALWFMANGMLMAEDELHALYGPALGGETEITDDTYAVWPLFPSWPTLQSIVELLFDTPQFFSAFWNTCLLAFAQSVGQILIAAPMAWAFAKLRFAGRHFLWDVYLVLMILPFQVLMAPNYLIATGLGLYDTPWAVILSGMFSAFPVFIIRRFFDDIPDVLLEAASLDGASEVTIFFRIGLPLGYAGVFSALILGLIEAWNAVEPPLLLLPSQKNWPLSLYMNELASERTDLAMAAGFLTLLPVLLFFLSGQEYLESGIQATQIKPE